jgi:neutral trehalase
MSETHDRWIRRLCRTWPEGVAARQSESGEGPNSKSVEPWPETWRDPEGMAMQCLHCRYYVELSGELGADWGACINEFSQYDGQLVFEHWTCREWAEELKSPEKIKK